MSTLKALLQDVPVEWKALGEIYKFQYGKGNTIPSTGGQYPVYGSNGIVGCHYEYNSEDAPVIGHIGAYAGIVHWAPGKHFVTYNGVICGLINENVLPRYGYYQLIKQDFNSLSKNSSQPFVSYKELNSVIIPVPPLAIQQEIVRVLDGLSEQNKALTAALAQEIDQRKKQYAYYREALFRFEGKEVEWKSITELFDLKNGYTPSKKIESFWKDGTIPWFRMEDIRANGRILDNAIQTINEFAVKGGKLFSANSIIIATSATIGEHALITVPYMANQRFTNLNLKSAFKNRFNMMFIYHYCFVLDEWCKKNTTVGNFAGVNMDGFKKFKFPIPSIQEQERIVRLLDQFDEATKNIVVQLEKEIELRNKQYEYYRNLLLSFPN